MTYWGYHLILDCDGCDLAAITDKEHIADFAKTLVKAIDMVAYGEPQVVKFGSGNKAGYTLVQLIETSNICGHFVDSERQLYLDVFSCKPFDRKTVVDLTKQFFGFTSHSEGYLERQASPITPTIEA